MTDAVRINVDLVPMAECGWCEGGGGTPSPSGVEPCLYCAGEGRIPQALADELVALKAALARPENERVKQLRFAQASIDSLERALREARK